MIEKRIEHIAYKLSENRKENQPGAIVLIGAGCSVSAGIPTAGIIVDQVLEKHKDNPDIKAFGSKPSYADLMACLGPVQRKAIFRDYVGKARINVSHIYLAHLLAEGYVDYILTVNFDDLALRAMALYNVFPPVYDLSILKDLTTTTLDTRSLTFLHGRHNGLWQLNTRDEMAKIGPVADSILNKIANNRPWIVVGYSGDDFIFDRLVNLGRFENGLYWIGYQKEEPSRRVREKLLDNPLSESFWVKGYDADSFFLALNSAMPIGDPGIFNKPFSFLAGLQENIKDIDGSDEYKAVKVRFETSKEWVQDAINKYETTGEKKPEMTSEEISLSQLKKALVDCLIAKKYDDLESLEQQVSALDDPELRSLLASIYFNWGTDLGNEAQAEPGPASVEKFRTAFEKYAKSLAYNPQKYEAYYNWGCDLRNLSDQVTGPEQEAYTLEACDKFREALRIHPQDANSLINWGKALGDLAAVKQGDESDSLAKGAFTKYEQASHINPDDEVLWSNWGTYLGNYANRKRGEEAKALFLEAFEKYTRSIGIIPDRFKTLYNWGIHLSNLADMREGDEKKEYFLQSIQKLSDATSIEPAASDAWYSWGIALVKLGGMSAADEAATYYRQALEKFGETIRLKPGNSKAWMQAGNCLTNLAMITTDAEAMDFFAQADEKYTRAADLDAEDPEIWYRWATSQGACGRRQTGPRSEELIRQAAEKFDKAVAMGGQYYNYACFMALTGDPGVAFRLLESALEKGEERFSFVEKDTDWNGLRDHPRYRELKEKYLKN